MANRFSSIQCVQPTSVHRISSRLRLWYFQFPRGSHSNVISPCLKCFIPRENLIFPALIILIRTPLASRFSIEGKSAIRVVIAGLDLGKDGNRNPAAADDGSPLTWDRRESTISVISPKIT